MPSIFGPATTARPRRGAQDIPAAPFGFAPPPSKMQQTLEILNEYNPLPAFGRLLHSPFALGGPISEQDIADGLTVAGSVMGGGAAAPKPRNALNMGIKAYHGSPHDFDRFDMSKIGTGEGAQAYGHGLYFADSENVAKSYRDTLTKSGTEGAQRRLKAAGGDIEKAISDVTARAANYRANGAPQYADAIEEDLRALQKFKETGEWSAGRMYEVQINADPESFLDWDKPLSEQPEAVRKGFGSLVDRDLSKETGWAKMSGQQALDAIMERYGSLDWPDNADATLRQQYRTNARSKASALLADKGIPGIKYLDAGSRVPSAMARKELADWQAQLSVAERELADATARGDQWLVSRKQAEVKRVQDGIARVAKEAEGTRNYVVFDDRLISIVRKYGIAGASAMLGYNILEGMDPAQAEELKRIEGNQ